MVNFCIPEYCERYMKHITHKMHFFTSSNIWDHHIRKGNVILWLKNFNDNFGRYIAHKILDNFIYYSDPEVEAICIYLVDLLKREIIFKHFLKDKTIPCESYINEEWEKVLKSLRFIPVKDTDPATSGLVLCQKLKTIGIDSDLITFSHSIPKLINDGIKYIIFIDDFIGTGKQASTFFNNKDLFNNGYSISDIANNHPEVNFYYITVAGTEMGIAKLHNDSNNIKLIVSEILTEEYCMFSPKCNMWESPEEQKAAESYIAQISKEMGIDDNCKGFGELSLLLAFSHCIPNNALPLLWYSENGWNPLIRRND